MLQRLFELIQLLCYDVVGQNLFCGFLLGFNLLHNFGVLLIKLGLESLLQGRVGLDHFLELILNLDKLMI